MLLGALARKYAIPSRLGLADVKNHLSSQQLIDFLRSDIFVMHGFIELYLPDPQGEMHWVKATPAFNERLCRLMKVDVLEFDGYNDSIFQEFDENGGQHMEYLADHGTFADVPMDFILPPSGESVAGKTDEGAFAGSGSLSAIFWRAPEQIQQKHDWLY